MRAILSPAWWVSVIASTLVTMAMILLIKKAAQKVNIPVISDAIQEV